MKQHLISHQANNRHPQAGWIRLVLTMLFFAGSVTSLASERELLLGEIDPNRVQLGAFLSYQHQRLLIAFIQKKADEFDCLPNQYQLYHWETEDFHTVEAGNLKISSDYQSVFRTRIHSLGLLTDANRQMWRQRAEVLMSLLNISAATMEQGKTSSQKSGTACWQQPELLDMNLNPVHTYPYLAANLCRHTWCSELYWTGNRQIRFWIQQTPDQYQLITLNTATGTISYLQKSQIFNREWMEQANAPRENLVRADNLSGHQIMLSAHQLQRISFQWKGRTNGKIAVILRRNYDDPKGAKRQLPRISAMIEQRQVPEAMQLIRFALWLEPDQLDIKIERLKAFAALLMLESLYESLSRDFTPADRFSACQRLHLEEAFRKLWQRTDFIQKFQEICS
jgi:hypothetical protein